MAECEAAAAVIGPLGLADDSDIFAASRSPPAQRARHVVSECRRVRACAAAFAAGGLAGRGTLMTESHRSLADDFDVSTAALDDLVEHCGSSPACSVPG